MRWRTATWGCRSAFTRGYAPELRWSQNPSGVLGTDAFGCPASGWSLAQAGGSPPNGNGRRAEGRGDTVRLRVRGILRGVLRRGDGDCRPVHGPRGPASGSGKSETRRTSGPDVGCNKPTNAERGESRRGGVEPRGRNGIGRWEPSDRREGSDPGPGVDTTAEKRWRGGFTANLGRWERKAPWRCEAFRPEVSAREARQRSRRWRLSAELRLQGTGANCREDREGPGR
jgi:hypothetical protein